MYIYKSKLCTPTGMMNYVVFFLGSRIEQTSRCCSPKIVPKIHLWFPTPGSSILDLIASTLATPMSGISSTRRYLPSYACWLTTPP